MDNKTEELTVSVNSENVELLKSFGFDFDYNVDMFLLGIADEFRASIKRSNAEKAKQKVYEGCAVAFIRRPSKEVFNCELWSVLEQHVTKVKAIYAEKGWESMILFISTNDTRDVVIIRRNDTKFDPFLGTEITNINFGSFKRERNIIVRAKVLCDGLTVAFTAGSVTLKRTLDGWVKGERSETL